METQSKEAASIDPGAVSPSSNVDSVSHPPELDDPKPRKMSREEAIDFLSGAALVFAIPGPLLVLIAYILPLLSVRETSLTIFLAGFYLGLIFNAFGLVMGLRSLFRWKGIIAVCTSIGWYYWVYWAITTFDWAI